MRKMHVPFASPEKLIDNEQIEAVARVLKSGQYIIGENVEAFEREFAGYIGTRYAVAVSSGTTALHLALLAHGIGPGDEVVTVPNSFIATSNAILYVGAKPVFADVDSEIHNIDPSKLKEKVSSKTKAIIPVHLYGHSADMDPISDLAEERGLRVIEDACQAHGATYKAKKVGSLGDVGCFSFYPSKNLFVGTDGGMITTNNEETAEKLRMLRNYGQAKKYEHPILGYNFRPSEISSAIGRVNLKRLDDWNEKRRRIAHTYSQLLHDTVTIPVEKKWAKHVYHVYVIKTERRDALNEYLKSVGITCIIHYPIPIHLQRFYMEMFGFHEGMFPATEKLARVVLSIPMHPALTSDQVEYVTEKINSFFKK